MKGFYASLVLLIPGLLRAQTDTTRSRQLDEVVITADKTSTKLSQTGKMVDVITRAQLERSGAKSLSQILGEQPGIIVGGAGSNPGSVKSIYMEGAGNGYTLIMVDGVPLMDASSTDNSIDLRSLTLEDIDRIEIVKGSQSVLYGSDAIAGVINIITKKGADKPIALAGQGSYGTNNTWSGNVSAGGKVGRVLKYNAGFGYYKTDGIPEATDTMPGTPNPRDGSKQYAFHAALDWQAAKGVTISPFLRYSHFDGSADGGSFLVDTSFTYTLTNLQTGVQSLAQLGKGQLHLVYAFNRTHRNDLDDSLPNLNAKGFFSSDAFTGYEHYGEAFVSYPVTGRVNVVGGVDYRHLSTEQTSLYLYPGSPVSPGVLSKDSAHYQQVGVYASATAKLPGGVYLDGGLRYNNNSRYGNSLVFNADPSVTIAHRIKLFANFSSGYKVPSLYQLYSSYGNKDLKPEKALSLEGGAEYTAGPFRLRAAYFDRWLQDVIFFSSTSTPPYGLYINQNKERQQGVETEASWTIIPRLQLTANYTYVTGTVTDKSGEGGSDTTYPGLYRIPKNSAGAALSYQFRNGFFVSTNVQWQDKRTDLYYDGNIGGDAKGTLHAFTLWNAYAEYKLPSWQHIKFFVDARNITGATYMETYGYNTLGFTFTGGLRLYL
ncbi:TonB-dependent receptor plug domain-containing protein [Dinghuibacter silviterrae]|uniref:Vitamin B12 transporter n=1 Tax=Dinghuibacter silviterrae TaxID=1539049 RepID=A0A4V3GLM4_9BACT|nr:TonB-dependent receptor [Dinghuibacter silviterrae]TDX00083.1 vitamin B12 transporter [Dinghuibacter silviterrae]